jgi:putative NIF3 family GTP cyclohydrolase 1 type 2
MSLLVAYMIWTLPTNPTSKAVNDVPSIERSFTSPSFTNTAATHSSTSMLRQKPTHAAVTRFIASILPPKENDVSRIYLAPRTSLYNPDTAVIEQLVLSISPTPGVYSQIEKRPKGAYPNAPVSQWNSRTIAFLHRPFDLEPKNVRNSTLVLASHTSFDEHLTVGWNPALAEQLGMCADASLCIKGFKGDAERKIGIVGQVVATQQEMLDQIRAEFGEPDMVQPGLSDEIRVVAIMNAFSRGEVRRVLATAQKMGLVSDDEPEAQGRHVLFLTGQSRPGGLQDATALGYTVVCVGHKKAEEWGIRYLAARLREAYPKVKVREIYEEEMPVEKPKKKEPAPAPVADPEMG